MIACYGGDTVRATEKFAEYLDPDVHLIVSADFSNDCVNTALAVASRLGRRLWGVRLGTEDTVVDSALAAAGQNLPGVNPELVWQVRHGLDRAGFDYVKIVAAGDQSPDKIRTFEEKGVPVDAYAVGQCLLRGEFSYYADVVQVAGSPCVRAGITYRPSSRLSPV